MVSGRVLVSPDSFVAAQSIQPFPLGSMLSRTRPSTRSGKMSYGEKTDLNCYIECGQANLCLQQNKPKVRFTYREFGKDVGTSPNSNSNNALKAGGKAISFV